MTGTEGTDRTGDVARWLSSTDLLLRAVERAQVAKAQQVTGITNVDLSDIAAELRDAIADHDQICLELGPAEAKYKKAYLTAHAASTTFHPERKVKEHEVAAEEAAFEAWAELNAMQYGRKALAERMHSLRQVLSAMQTQIRTEREFAR